MDCSHSLNDTNLTPTDRKHGQKIPPLRKFYTPFCIVLIPILKCLEPFKYLPTDPSRFSVVLRHHNCIPMISRMFQNHFQICYRCLAVLAVKKLFSLYPSEPEATSLNTFNTATNPLEQWEDKMCPRRCKISIPSLHLLQITFSTPQYSGGRAGCLTQTMDNIRQCLISEHVRCFCNITKCFVELSKQQ